MAATEEKGGCKSASATISGHGVYGRLKYESGIHRVQRVPATEASGRVHTSAASVAILPQADEVKRKKQKRKKRNEKFTLFSDHNESLLRRQPGELMRCGQACCFLLSYTTHAHPDMTV